MTALRLLSGEGSAEDTQSRHASAPRCDANRIQTQNNPHRSPVLRYQKTNALRGVSDHTPSWGASSRAAMRASLDLACNSAHLGLAQRRCTDGRDPSAGAGAHWKQSPCTPFSLADALTCAREGIFATLGGGSAGEMALEDHMARC